MAFRFQRRIKIAPGLTLNLSKSGLGLSAGVRGARVSVGSRGTHSHVGLPGTGLAYRKKISPYGSRKPSPRQSQSGAIPVPDEQSFTIQVDEDSGETTFVSETTGQPVTMVRLRKFVANADEAVKAYLEALLEQRNGLLDSLGILHHAIPHPDRRPPSLPRAFTVKPPGQPIIRKPRWFEKLWPPFERRLVKANHLNWVSYKTQLADWERRKIEFEEGVLADHALRERVDAGDLESMAAALEQRFSGIHWPITPGICFDLGNDPTTIAVDVGFPTEEAFPAIRWRKSSTGRRLLSKELSASGRRTLYRDYLHSVTLRLVGEIFAGLAVMHRVAVSIWTSVPDTGFGGMKDVCLMSIIVKRGEWRHLRFNELTTLDPVAAVGNFHLRRSMTKTGIFKPVDPFGLEDLESNCDGNGTIVR